jgi:alkylation response protein AidB-like acyl-CoA dehydrogenase
VAAKTGPSAGGRGISLLIIDTQIPGFSVGRVLDKIGQKGSDTAELSFDNVRVPADQLLGVDGRGFRQMMAQLPQLASQPRQAIRDTKRALNLHLRQAVGRTIDFALAADGESMAGEDVMDTVDRFTARGC